MTGKHTPRNNRQLIWGIALVLAGIGVFVRIPMAMPKLAQFFGTTDLWGARIALYIMGALLIGGGIQKIFRQIRPASGSSTHAAGEIVDK